MNAKIKCEFQTESELGASNLQTTVKKESCNEGSSEYDSEWICPDAAHQPTQSLKADLTIVKSEYDIQPNFFSWTIDELADGDEEVKQEVDEVETVEHLNHEDDENEDDDDVDDDDDYNEHYDASAGERKQAKAAVSVDSDVPPSKCKKKKLPKAKRKQKYIFFQKKRALIDQHLLRLCPFCGMEFECATTWEKHLNEVHSYMDINKTHFTSTAEDDKVSCNECKTTVNNRMPVMKKHLLMHLPYMNIFKCKICSYARSQCMLLRCHVERKHFEVVDEKLKGLTETNSFRNCIYCGKYVGILTMLSMHIQDEHGSIYEHKLWYVCPACGEKFPNKKAHKEHLEKVHQFESLHGLSFELIELEEDGIRQKKYRCLKCSTLYAADSYSIALIHHALTHLPHKCFKCRYCDYATPSRSHIIQHSCPALLLDIKNNPLVTVQPTTSQIVRRKFRILDVTNKLHVCPKCGEDFDRQPLWETHLIKEHGFDKQEPLNMERIPAPDGKGEIAECKTCNKQFLKPNMFFLRQHAFMHMPHKLYKCKLCQAATNSLFVCTCQDESKKEKSATVAFVCPKCSQEFNNEYFWNNHLNKKHNLREASGLHFYQIDFSKTPSYKCFECDVVIQEATPTSTELLFKHATLKHMPYKCYKCSFCTEIHDNKQKMAEHCSSCYNRVNKDPSVIKNRKLKLFKEVVVKKRKRAPRKKRDKSQPKIEKKKPVKVKTEPPTDPLEIDTNNVKTFTKARMAICTPKTLALNKYKQHITYACPECNLPLKTSEAWHKHISTEHDFFAEESLNITPIPNERHKGRCNECSLTVHGSLLHRQRHKLTHMPYQAFVCSICIHRAKTLNVLYDHFERKHFRIGEFKCVFCDANFTTAYERYEHVQAQHPNDKSRGVCKICCHRYQSESRLREHMAVHEYNRVHHDCGYCERKYTTVKERFRHWNEMHPKELELYHSNEQEKIPARNKRGKMKKGSESKRNTRSKKIKEETLVEVNELKIKEEELTDDVSGEEEILPDASYDSESEESDLALALLAKT